ncbi:Phox homologous domain-containing protein [Kockovaella imperatae]|uniref:Phox homologous domain-containing protein n=1 Tax=Kockovaella imperatae TaxID=4999 RepID=A0A1Y1U9D0_9TREE|nr:Phox homologous domain-containing protein [Kockovaella imperatae]ORX34639.1 Phox homologous domain-containing protein [Kockovaella imperatae]
MSEIQSISIVSTQTVAQPKPHTTYTVQVTTPMRSWTVSRRYNDFVALNDELLSSTGKAPPAALPPKHPWSITRSAYDQKVIRERKVLLEAYLRAILNHRDPRWRSSYTYLDFLAAPAASSSSVPTSWTPSNWLSEHTNIQAQLRTARSALLKRDALAGMGDAPGSRGASVEAKKMLRDVGERIDALSQALGDISKSIGEGERKRREEMIEGLKNERGDLQRMADAGVRTIRDMAPKAGETSGFGAGSRNMPGSIPNGSGAVGPAPGRVFGRQPPPEETSETRPLDDRGLLQLQQTKMDDQDSQLEELSKILRRQRNMGEDIDREIRDQNEILDEIQTDVDKVGGKMARAKRQLNKLS